MKNTNIPFKIMLSYAQEDKEVAFTLIKYLKPLVIDHLIKEPWLLDHLMPGEDINSTLGLWINDADLILIILSAHYIDSKYDTEFSKIVNTGNSNNILLILSRECVWNFGILDTFPFLPESKNPITNLRHWDSSESPYVQVAQSIKSLVLNNEKTTTYERKTTQPSVVLESQLIESKAQPSKDELEKFYENLLIYLEELDKQTQWDPNKYITLEAKVKFQKKSDLIGKITTLKNVLSFSESSISYLLLGEPGAGKSVALRELCKDLLNSKNLNKKIPIYINLRDWFVENEWSKNNIPTPVDLELFVINFLIDVTGIGSANFIKKYFHNLYLQGNFFFFFDSFDEIPSVLDSYDKSSLIDSLSSIIYKFSIDTGCNIILSSREFKRPSEKFNANVVLNLQPLTEDMVIEVLEKSNVPQKVIKEIYNHQIFKPLAKNPFTLSLIVDYLEFSDFNLPSNQLDLFDKCIDNRLSQDIIEEDFKISKQDIINSAKIISKFLFQDKKYGLSISIDDLISNLKGYSLNSTLTILWESRIARIGKGRFSFIHRKFHEYFVALSYFQKEMILPVEDIPTNSRHRDSLIVYCEIADPETLSSILTYCWEEVKKLKISYQAKNDGHKHQFDQMVSPVLLDIYKKDFQLHINSETNDKELLLSEEFIKFRDNYFNKRYGNKVVSMDDQYMKSLHCLRFLVEGFKIHQSELAVIQKELYDLISSNVTSIDNLIYKKHLIEAIALLSHELAEKTIIKLFYYFKAGVNTYLLESMITSIKYLKSLSPELNKILIDHYLSEEKNFALIDYKMEKHIRVLSLSDSFKTVVTFLKNRRFEKIIFFCAFLFVHLFLSYMLIYYFLEGREDSNKSFLPFLFTFILLQSFTFIAFSKHLLVISLIYNFQVKIFSSKKRSISIYRVLYYLFLIVLFFILIFYSISLGGEFYPDSDDIIAKGLSIALITVVSVIILGMLFLLGRYTIIQSNNLLDLILFSSIKKSIKKKPISRIEISNYFYQFHNSKYRYKFIHHLYLLQLTPSGNWPDNVLPNHNNDEASGLLAQLEEKWLNLN